MYSIDRIVMGFLSEIVSEGNISRYSWWNLHCLSEWILITTFIMKNTNISCFVFVNLIHPLCTFITKPYELSFASLSGHIELDSFKKKNTNFRERRGWLFIYLIYSLSRKLVRLSAYSIIECFENDLILQNDWKGSR